ncbi:gamma-glutamylcyclotransferase family protein [Cerasicoccus maritimus]|uniref:gamma-glutamylcyclotransferase family protein n=1 Tax=Cerasicoccus maritimus TaxID=490089 RepID=UPI0028529344|nr:gamma-glutamylcyclotransferase [Cerasicoccus maritimus]
MLPQHMGKKTQPRVFVYGTLKPGGYYWHRFCEGRVSQFVKAKVKGNLYALPMGYPAMAPGDGWAHGYLLTLHDEAVLKGFDTLEDYEPGRCPSENEYQRVEVNVYLEDGEDIGAAWTYVMDIDRINSHQGVIIANGDWDVDDPDTLPSLC